MNITIDDFMYLCIEDGTTNVEIFDNDSAEVVWSGRGNDIPDEYLDVIVGSWDISSRNQGTITFNIDLEY